jgi:outer membrane protein insertion porin family
MEPFVIKDIKIEGLQRTEPGTVFNYLPVQVGDTMTEDKAAEAIKSLYRTGYFKDVRIESDFNLLIVTVQERPWIADIQFSGNKAFATDKIKEGLKSVGIVEGQIYDKSRVDQAELEIKKQYLAQGKYSAIVKTAITPLERNRVQIKFNIEEGIVAKISEINIVGNKVFAKDSLLEDFQQKTTNWLSWWYKDDQYSKQKLTADLETLKSFYMNKGYLEFSIDSTQVSITQDKKEVFITINISEGEKYSINEIKFVGNSIIPPDELKTLVKVKEGDIFNRQKLNESTKAINERLGNEGFAFSNVNPIPEMDKESHTAKFTFYVDPGRKVYVRRVDIEGNRVTKDEVIRREFRQIESSWYAADKIDRSKVRLNRTQYFSDVNFETPAVPGTSDQVDLKVKVTEKNTGAVSLGAGLSSSEGIVGSFNISQANFFGTGQRVQANINTGSVNKTYAFSILDPYFTIDGVARSLNFYRRDVNTASLSIATYSTSSLGAGINFSVPLSEKNAITYGIAFDNTDVTLTSASPARYQAFCSSVSGNASGCTTNNLTASLGFSTDTRDDIMFPTKGGLEKVFAEVALPGFEIQMYKLNYQKSIYQPLLKNTTFMLAGQLGYQDSYGGTTLPFYKHFFTGGVGSIRGYRQGAIGPVEIEPATGQNVFVGGNKQVIGNAELFFPLPFAKDNKQLRASIFIDAGSVYAKNETISLGDLRYSAGAGIMWVSPFGPLKLLYAKALNPQSTDITESIQFQVGTQF